MGEAQLLRDKLRDLGIQASANEHFEKLFKEREFPTEFSDLLLTAKGMKIGVYDNDLIHLNNVEEMLTCNFPNLSVYLNIGDYLIGSHSIGLMQTDSELQFWLYDGANARQICSGVEAFVRLYLHHPTELTHI